MSGWRAHVELDSAETFVLRRARILLMHPVGDGRYEYLAEDGLIRIAAEGTAPDDAGMFVPRDAVEALAAALQPHAPHAIELRRLEEALRVERARVDRMLERATIPGAPDGR